MGATLPRERLSLLTVISLWMLSSGEFNSDPMVLKLMKPVKLLACFRSSFLLGLGLLFKCMNIRSDILGLSDLQNNLYLNLYDRRYQL